MIQRAKIDATSNIVAGLDINPRIISAANRAGCGSSWNLLCTSKSELEQKTGLSGSDVDILISAVAKYLLPKQISAWEMLEDTDYNIPRISAGCSQLDQFLGGGIPSYGITDITGESGCGKTQLALQLSLQAQLSPNHGGFGKGVAYICTECQFPVVRLHQLISQMKKKFPQGPESYTDRLFIHHISDVDNLLDCIRYQLPALASRHQIGLVIIDSVAAVFRAEDGAEVNKPQALQMLGYKLHQLSSLNDIAVVTINQVTASINNKNLYGMNSDVTPALGLSWANLVTTRLILSRCSSYIGALHFHCSDDKGKVEPHALEKSYRQVKYRLRMLEVLYCPWLPRKSVPFVITTHGLENIDPNTVSTSYVHDS
ncbi:DNA repair protein xrcc3 [Halocaridina rubra]|uniref:DNA repair protein xrcc3 n=1 Tax=Halocaridina rubra TaxID=373956 RepID=A0AAN8WZE8_HALRR